MSANRQAKAIIEKFQNGAPRDDRVVSDNSEYLHILNY